MSRLLVLAAAAWFAFTMLLADVIGTAASPAAARSAVLVQYGGLLLLSVVFAFPRRRTR